jgi:hypothetical protein
LALSYFRDSHICPHRKRIDDFARIGAKDKYILTIFYPKEIGFNGLHEAGTPIDGVSHFHTSP